MIFDLVLIVLAFLIVAVIPGYVTVRLIGLRFQSGYELLAVSTALGLFSINLLYFFFRFFSDREAHFLIPLLAVEGAGLIYLSSQKRLIFESFKVSRRECLRVFLPWAAVTGLLLFIFFRWPFTGLAYTGDGGLKITHGLYTDYIWYPGIAAHLKNLFPPEVPTYAGYRLKYHYFAPLFAAHLAKMTGLDILAIYFQYAHLMLIPILCGVAFYAFRLLLRKPSFLFVSLVLFIFLRDNRGFYHSFYDTMRFLVVVLILYFLSRWAQEKRGKPALLLCGFLMSMIAMYEAFYAVVILPVAGLSGILLWVYKKRKDLFWTAVGATAGGAAIYILACGVELGRRGGLFSFDMPFYKSSVIEYKAYATLLKAATLALHGKEGFFYVVYQLERFFTHLFFLLLHYVTQLGVGILGFPLLWKFFRNFKRLPADQLFVSLLIVTCLFFPLFIGVHFWRDVTLRTLSLGVSLLAILAGHNVAGFFRGRLVSRVITGFFVAVFFVYPFLERQVGLGERKRNRGFYTWISPDHLEAFRFIRQKTPVRAVVMHPYVDDPVYYGLDRMKPAWIFEDHYYYMSILGERMALSEGSIRVTEVKTLVGLEEIQLRRQHIQTFYQTDRKFIAEEILKRYPIDYVWVDEKNPLKFKLSEKLEKVFSNGVVTLYKNHLR